MQERLLCESFPESTSLRRRSAARSRRLPQGSGYYVSQRALASDTGLAGPEGDVNITAKSNSTAHLEILTGPKGDVNITGPQDDVNLTVEILRPLHLAQLYCGAAPKLNPP